MTSLSGSGEVHVGSPSSTSTPIACQGSVFRRFAPSGGRVAGRARPRKRGVTVDEEAAHPTGIHKSQGWPAESFTNWSCWPAAWRCPEHWQPHPSTPRRWHRLRCRRPSRCRGASAARGACWTCCRCASARGPRAGIAGIAPVPAPAAPPKPPPRRISSPQATSNRAARRSRGFARSRDSHGSARDPRPPAGEPGRRCAAAKPKEVDQAVPPRKCRASPSSSPRSACRCRKNTSTLSTMLRRVAQSNQPPARYRR